MWVTDFFLWKSYFWVSLNKELLCSKITATNTKTSLKPTPTMIMSGVGILVITVNTGMPVLELIGKSGILGVE